MFRDNKTADEKTPLLAKFRRNKNTAENTLSLSKLPDDVLKLIISETDNFTKANLASTSKTMRRLVNKSKVEYKDEKGVTQTITFNELGAIKTQKLHGEKVLAYEAKERKFKLARDISYGLSFFCCPAATVPSVFAATPITGSTIGVITGLTMGCGVTFIGILAATQIKPCGEKPTQDNNNNNNNNNAPRSVTMHG